MSKIVRYTEAEIQDRLVAERSLPEYKARMERLKNIRDEDIDFSDIPEWTDAQFARATRPGRGGARVGAGRKPSGNQSIQLRLRPTTVRRLRAVAKKRKVTLSQIVEERLAGV